MFYYWHMAYIDNKVQVHQLSDRVFNIFRVTRFSSINSQMNWYGWNRELQEK